MKSGETVRDRFRWRRGIILRGKSGDSMDTRGIILGLEEKRLSKSK